MGLAFRAWFERKLAPGLAPLRPAPLALPVGDPLLARIASLFADAHLPDVKERLTEIALSLQWLADHRARLTGLTDAHAARDAATELDWVLAPLSRVVDAIAVRVQALGRLGACPRRGRRGSGV